MDVLCISAHPDDETLGCGGTLLQHGDRGDRLHWLIATCATVPEWSAEVVRRKQIEVDCVADAYGMASVHRLGYPATRLAETPERRLLDDIRSVVEECRPSWVYVVHAGDIHGDHRVLNAATMAVLKWFHLRRLGVRRVLAYETLSSTESGMGIYKPFVPNVLNDISSWVDRKIEVMRMYASEVQADPLPRGESAIRALARWRGAAAGVAAAEAFVTLREYRGGES